MDGRIEKLSKVILEHACNLQTGERVLLEGVGQGTYPLIRQLIRDVYAKGAIPFVHLQDQTVTRELMLGCTEGQLRFEAEYEMLRMKGMDAYVAVRGAENSAELYDVPKEKQRLYAAEKHPVTTERVDNTKWVAMRYPSPAAAQMAGMSCEAFEDFYFRVCNLDYRQLSRAMEPLAERMNRADQVRITGPGTDIRFSIRGIPADAASGFHNLPDGEVFTAPVRDSVNGTITYNAPSSYMGFLFQEVRLEVKDGKIIDARANNTEYLNQILDRDEGARYFGEFALGVNPYITKPMGDTLFDEKICGSFHLTPGNAYAFADNGNHSSIHWDLISIQTEDFGGGQIYFDGELIRENGRYVPADLLALNPENF